MNSPSANTQNQTIELEDGRTLGIAEYGDPAGKTIFFFHGQPGNRLFHPSEEITKSANIRLILPDRPGYGRSSWQPDRKITDWANDILQLADHLGLAQFPVIGYSAGGPYALACAAQIPEMISTVILIGSAPPLDDPEIRQQMSWMVRANRFFITFFPELTYQYFKLFWVYSRKNPENLIQLSKKLAPPADKKALEDPEIYNMLLDTWKENLQIDPGGYVDDARRLMEDWGFDLNSVKQNVHLIWGEMDKNVPISILSYYEDHLPASSSHILANQGHFGFLRQWKSILEIL